MARKQTATVNVTLRIREDLRRRIEHEAKKRKHSLNQELARRLEASFAVDDAKRTLDSVQNLANALARGVESGELIKLLNEVKQ
jgi:hypothetical protein